MTAITLDRLHTPEADQLRQFRATHSAKYLQSADDRWEYFGSGRGTENLLILPGLIGVAEMSFQLILAFESDYRVITPSYPSSVQTTAQLVKGIASLLDVEGIWQTHVLGGSYGGMVAQGFVRQYPARVGRLILSHTGGPKAERASKSRQFAALMRWLPMGVLRWLLTHAGRKALQDAPAQRAFWEAYTAEIAARLTKADLLARYVIAADFDATSNFSPDDLNDWTGRLLILEGDNDPIAEAPAREALKVFYPNARVHTFHGSGHVAPIARVEEYVSVIKEFLQIG